MTATSSARLFFSTAVAALGGLLFGYDTALVSGLAGALERAFHLSGYQLGLVVAAALLGTIAGTLVAARVTERLGRRGALAAAALLYLAAVAGSATAHLLPALVAFRIAGGVALGVASVVAPMYIAEIAPARLRGRLVAVSQLALVGGILLGYLASWSLAGVLTGPDAWRWMLATEAVPAGALLLLLPLALASPHLRTAPGAATPALFQARHARPILLAAAVALLNQLSGVNALLFFAPRVFVLAGADDGGALLRAAIVGGTNLAFTALGLLLIDRVGRRPLLMLGGAGAALSLALTAAGLASPAGAGPLVLAGLLGFIAFHAIGQGAVIWVFISEIFPARVRGKGQALGSFTHWVAAALVSWTFPVLVDDLATPLFAFFSLMMIVQLLFAWKLMPETRGLSLEEVEARLAPRPRDRGAARLAGAEAA